MTNASKLHFVYNVDATPVSLMMDFIHRIVDPATYPCRLCDLTYGRLIKKKSWRDFVATLPVPSEFHLRAGFRRAHPGLADEDLPAVFVERADGAVEVLISAAELREIETLTGLERLVRLRAARAAKPKSTAKTARARAPVKKKKAKR